MVLRERIFSVLEVCEVRKREILKYLWNLFIYVHAWCMDHFDIFLNLFISKQKIGLFCWFRKQQISIYKIT